MPDDLNGDGHARTLNPTEAPETYAEMRARHAREDETWRGVGEALRAVFADVLDGTTSSVDHTARPAKKGQE